jgi:hypothetical protein
MRLPFKLGRMRDAISHAAESALSSSQQCIMFGFER